MPLVSSNYDPPFLFKNGHFATIYSGLLRTIKDLHQERERIPLPDGDFLDLDWSLPARTATKVAVVLHGLEGNAQRAYIQGSAKALNAAGYVVCAVEIKGAVAISVPCQLADSLTQLLSFKNKAYATRFKKNLVEKLQAKQQLFPEKISDSDIKNVVTLKDFDDIYTSKAHGFTDAMDYYAQCSCLQFLKDIKVPALIINAQNDSFLGGACYPIEEAKYSNTVFLEIPKYGGHVGFYGASNFTYTERRAVEFFAKLSYG